MNPFTGELDVKLLSAYPEKFPSLFWNRMVLFFRFWVVEHLRRFFTTAMSSHVNTISSTDLRLASDLFNVEPIRSQAPSYRSTSGTRSFVALLLSFALPLFFVILPASELFRC